VRLLPFSEQAPLYNAVNFNLTDYEVDNITVRGIALSGLMCPSDAWTAQAISKSTPNASFNIASAAYNFNPPYMQQFTSYGANEGTFDVDYRLYYGYAEWAQFKGTIYGDSSIKIADITDGTSNTFLYGEKAHNQMIRFDTQYGNSDNQWQSPRHFDTLISTFYPPNVQSNNSNVGSIQYYFPVTATSMHPGGCNFAFCDGSVRFIKNSISSWKFNVGGSLGYGGSSLPVGVTYAGYVYSYGPGTQLGVYQALSTRNGNEVVSGDQY
jgi:prepilin-type processing-associated H-X9-DG protein